MKYEIVELEEKVVTGIKIKTTNNKRNFIDLTHENSIKRKFYGYNYI